MDFLSKGLSQLRKRSLWAFDGWGVFNGWALPLAHLGLYCRFKNPQKKGALATATQLTAEASTIIFNAATVHLKALKATAKEVNKEVNTQVEVEDDEQSNSKVLIKTLA